MATDSKTTATATATATKRTLVWGDKKRGIPWANVLATAGYNASSVDEKFWDVVKLDFGHWAYENKGNAKTAVLSDAFAKIAASVIHGCLDLASVDEIPMLVLSGMMTGHEKIVPLRLSPSELFVQMKLFVDSGDDPKNALAFSYQHAGQNPLFNRLVKKNGKPTGQNPYEVKVRKTRTPKVAATNGAPASPAQSPDGTARTP